MSHHHHRQQQKSSRASGAQTASSSWAKGGRPSAPASTGRRCTTVISTEAWNVVVEQATEMQKLLAAREAKKRKASSSSSSSDNNDCCCLRAGASLDLAICVAESKEKDRRIADLEEKLLKGEQQRRALHDRIQELRGNIRVNVRTRPFLPSDGAVARQSSIVILPDGKSLKIQGARREGEVHSFEFDKVFDPSIGQDKVFEEVSEFIQSALDGRDVCLFSYGQSGSGKTHTMQGSDNGAMRGIIPRTMEQIMAEVTRMRMQSQQWTFTVKASFLEIYNEKLRDLLVRDTNTAPRLVIRENLEGKVYVEGINIVDIDVENEVEGMAQLEAVMATASRARSVATTNMNAQSSRSHSIFMLRLCCSHEASGTTMEATLHLCDLAGSERLDSSGNASDPKRIEETKAISKSLSCLGNVFRGIAQGKGKGNKFVNFRDSKLTRLLQNCFSGTGKVLMLVNLSPTPESLAESLCSLQFARDVNLVELGTTTKHVQHSGKGSSSVKTGS